jgi:proline dehydrogenase
MALMRRLLLAGSTSPWLRERATKTRFVRRSVRRFMPGERLEDALAAARALQSQRITTILTALGENLTRPEEAEEVTAHYLRVFDEVAAAGLDAQVSVKPTQLGLDLDRGLCERHLDALVDRAAARGTMLWIDMEYSRYVDDTLALYRRARDRSRSVGLALQAYLYRTAQDLESLLSLGPAIRIVKGAYLEPPDVAYPKKADVDENYYRLCLRVLSPEARRAGALLHVATHDAALQGRIARHTGEYDIPPDAYEFAMLYGIGTARQARLSADGKRVRVLISYGEHWFPWYMRRLAERPANVWFVVRNIAG